jgi:hypothetical protein
VIGFDRLLDAVLPRQIVQFGSVRAGMVPLGTTHPESVPISRSEAPA